MKYEQLEEAIIKNKTDNNGKLNITHLDIKNIENPIEQWFELESSIRFGIEKIVTLNQSNKIFKKILQTNTPHAEHFSKAIKTKNLKTLLAIIKTNPNLMEEITLLKDSIFLIKIEQIKQNIRNGYLNNVTDEPEYSKEIRKIVSQNPIHIALRKSLGEEYSYLGIKEKNLILKTMFDTQKYYKNIEEDYLKKCWAVFFIKRTTSTKPFINLAKEIFRKDAISPLIQENNNFSRLLFNRFTLVNELIQEKIIVSSDLINILKLCCYFNKSNRDIETTLKEIEKNPSILEELKNNKIKLAEILYAAGNCRKSFEKQKYIINKLIEIGIDVVNCPKGNNTKETVLEDMYKDYPLELEEIKSYQIYKELTQEIQVNNHLLTKKRM